MIRKLILLTIVFMPLLAISQDLIILRNGEKINCKITKTDSLSVYYNIQKKNRMIDSFVEKNEIRSYQINDIANTDSTRVQALSSKNKTVILDTTVYVKSFNKWINLITYSQKYGIHASGWSMQYCGYILKNDSKWIIPVTVGIEDFQINQDYFNQFNYQAARMNYYMAGISPIRKLNDYFYVNVGFQLIFGTEQVVDGNYGESMNSVFGIAPFQGIMFISKSNFGICVGLGIYEKLLTSMFYQNDIGVKLEIGVKF
jgi:hypothetical protein